MPRPGLPKTIPIAHDDHYAQHIGTTADGRQFFLTNPFVPAMNKDPGREFIALYLFDAKGALLEARIDDLGPRAGLDEATARERFKRRLEELGPVKYKDIRVAPFQIERFGTVFGLVAQAPEEQGEDWWVTAEPGDYMAFSPPWTGEYDT
jgi:hypothetical protein